MISSAAWCRAPPPLPPMDTSYRPREEDALPYFATEKDFHLPDSFLYGQHSETKRREERLGDMAQALCSEAHLDIQRTIPPIFIGTATSAADIAVEEALGTMSPDGSFRVSRGQSAIPRMRSDIGGTFRRTNNAASQASQPRGFMPNTGSFASPSPSKRNAFSRPLASLLAVSPSAAAARRHSHEAHPSTPVASGAAAAEPSSITVALEVRPGLTATVTLVPGADPDRLANDVIKRHALDAQRVFRPLADFFTAQMQRLPAAKQTADAPTPAADPSTASSPGGLTRRKSMLLARWGGGASVYADNSAQQDGNASPQQVSLTQVAKGVTTANSSTTKKTTPTRKSPSPSRSSPRTTTPRQPPPSPKGGGGDRRTVLDFGATPPVRAANKGKLPLGGSPPKSLRQPVSPRVTTPPASRDLSPKPLNPALRGRPTAPSSVVKTSGKAADRSTSAGRRLYDLAMYQRAKMADQVVLEKQRQTEKETADATFAPRINRRPSSVPSRPPSATRRPAQGDAADERGTAAAGKTEHRPKDRISGVLKTGSATHRTTTPSTEERQMKECTFKPQLSQRMDVNKAHVAAHKGNATTSGQQAAAIHVPSDPKTSRTGGRGSSPLAPARRQHSPFGGVAERAAGPVASHNTMATGGHDNNNGRPVAKGGNNGVVERLMARKQDAAQRLEQRREFLSTFDPQSGKPLFRPQSARR